MWCMLVSCNKPLSDGDHGNLLLVVEEEQLYDAVWLEEVEEVQDHDNDSDDVVCSSRRNMKELRPG